MFKENKYTIWYHSIISKAKSQDRPNSKRRKTLRKNGTEISDYYEDHHIIPKSIGGHNKKDNIVTLTAKEHLICHLLLPKMVEGGNRKKMEYALWNLVVIDGNKKNKQSRNLRINSTTYEHIRKKCVVHSLSHRHSEESKKKISESNKRVKHLTSHHGEDNPEFKGYYHTPWGKFATANQATDGDDKYGMSYKRIIKLCKFPNTLFNIRKPTSIPIEWIGKTAKEVGFWFQEIDK